jgi:uncharacterized protein
VKVVIGAALFAAVLTLSACQSAPQKLSEEALLIVTAAGKTHNFTVEVARSAAEQKRGLMFRDKLAPNRGMIFPIDPPRTESFWMKDTLIPLDMVFIQSDGIVSQIAADAVPDSRAPIVSGAPVAAVLELAGGETEKRGIAVGDQVKWSSLGK